MDDWPDHTLENRRRMVCKTIRRATLEELKTFGMENFPVITDPWCERYNRLLTDHAKAHFYRASTPEGAEIVYCRETGSGMWFLPDSGMGIIQERGLKVLAEIVDSL